jgi:hypothetical protein
MNEKKLNLALIDLLARKVAASLLRQGQRTGYFAWRAPEKG